MSAHIKQLEILVNLTGEEAMERIISMTGADNGLFPAYRSENLNKKYLGKISGNSFSLRIKRMGRNSFAAIFEGKIIETGTNRSQISGTCRLHPFVKPFKYLWFTFLLFFCLFTIPVGVMMYHKNKSFTEETLMIGIPVFLILFGIIFFRIGSESFRKDEEAILKDLEQTFSENRSG